MARTLTINLSDKDYAVAITRAQRLGLPVERYPAIAPIIHGDAKGNAVEWIEMHEDACSTHIAISHKHCYA